MKATFPRLILPTMALAMGFIITACDDNNDNNVTGAGLIPRLTLTATATATATEAATPTASPTGTATATPTGSPAATPNEVFFRGQITSISGPNLIVAKQAVGTDAGTTFNRNGAPATLSQFTVGERVRIFGTYNPDGSVHATRLNFPED